MRARCKQFKHIETAIIESAVKLTVMETMFNVEYVVENSILDFHDIATFNKSKFAGINPKLFFGSIWL